MQKIALSKILLSLSDKHEKQGKCHNSDLINHIILSFIKSSDREVGNREISDAYLTYQQGVRNQQQDRDPRHWVPVDRKTNSPLLGLKQRNKDGKLPLPDDTNAFLSLQDLQKEIQEELEKKKRKQKEYNNSGMLFQFK